MELTYQFRKAGWTPIISGFGFCGISSMNVETCTGSASFWAIARLGLRLGVAMKRKSRSRLPDSLQLVTEPFHIIQYLFEMVPWFFDNRRVQIYLRRWHFLRNHRAGFIWWTWIAVDIVMFGRAL